MKAMVKTLIKLRKKLWLPFKYAILREKRKTLWGYRTMEEIEKKLEEETEIYFTSSRELHKKGDRDSIVKSEANINLLKWLLKREDQDINNI